MKKGKKEWSIFFANWHFVILALVIILYTAGTALFIRDDRSPLVADTVHHLNVARSAHLALTQRDIPYELNHFSYQYPPLVYIVTSLFFGLFGISIKTALWSLYPFSIVLILMFFFTGYHLGGKAGASGSLLIGASNCFFINYSHHYFFDMPYSSMSALAFFLLLKSEMFKNTKYSYLFGGALALGLLTHFNSVFFVIGPLAVMVCYFAAKSIRTFFMTLLLGGLTAGITAFFFKTGWDAVLLRASENESGSASSVFAKSIIILFLSVGIIFCLTCIIKKYLIPEMDAEEKETGDSIITGTRAILLAMAVSLPFYLFSMQRVLSRMIHHWEVGDLSASDVFVKNFFGQLANIINFFPLIYVLAPAGVIVFIIRRKQMLDYLMLASVLICGFILLCRFACPMGRYAVGLVFPVSVMGGYWIEYAGKLKFPILALVLSYSLLAIAYPLFSMDVPVSAWPAVRDPAPRSSRLPVPLYPANPDPDFCTGSYRIAGDIKEKYEKSVKRKYDAFDIHYHREMQEHGAPFVYFERLRPFYVANVRTILRYDNVDIPHEHNENRINSRDDSGLISALDENSRIPVFVILAYSTKDFPRHIEELIEGSTGRTPELVSLHLVLDNKKLRLYYIPPR